MLLDGKEDFPHHREILFAGLQAWVIYSGDSRFHRAALALATCDAIIQSERNDSGLADKPKRYRGLIGFFPEYRKLFDTIYYPLGGMMALKTAITRAPKNIELKDLAVTDAPALIRLATILDQTSRQLTDIKKLHFAGAIKALQQIDKGRRPDRKKSSKGDATSRTQIYDAKKGHASSWSFLYAASNIKFKDDKTLLDCLLKSPLKFADVGADTLTTWISYAAHFRSTVLDRMGDKLKKGPSLKKYEIKAPQIPPLSDDELKQVQTVYEKKKSSEARLQFKGN